MYGIFIFVLYQLTVSLINMFFIRRPDKKYLTDGLKVSVLVPSDGTVCIDHGLFLTVAENLIGNAVRFAEKAISIQITLQNDSMTLNVEDDGAGYPLSLVQNGPTPFETTSSNSSHFGMGLYSSIILCEKHGGRLILENRAGGGASAMAIFHFV